MYNRKLGTSKKEQGIETPKQPRVRNCGCIYEFKNKKWVARMLCNLHQIVKEIKKKGGKNAK